MSKLQYEVLKKYRVKNNYTQKQIADKLNLTQQAYANYENGIRTPNIEILIQLADIYDTSLDRLTGRDRPNE